MEKGWENWLGKGWENWLENSWGGLEACTGLAGNSLLVLGGVTARLVSGTVTLGLATTLP